MEPSPQNDGPSLRRLFVVLVILAAGITAFVLAFRTNSNAPHQGLSEKDRKRLEDRAWSALVDRRFRDARRLADEVLESFPNSERALLCAGQATYQMGEYDKCLAYYEKIPRSGSQASRSARCLAADVLFLVKHRVAPAEKLLKSVLKEQPDHGLANQTLGVIYLWLGCKQRAYPHLTAALANGLATRQNLIQIGWTAGLFGKRKFVDACLANDPENPIILQGIAHRESISNRDRKALEIIRKAERFAPADLEIRAESARLMLRLNQLKSLPKWHTELPAGANESPAIWFVRGLWLQQRGILTQASRCFWECLRRDPDHEEANYQMGQVLAAIGRSEDAAPFLKRSRDLADLNVVCANIDSGSTHSAMMLKAARLTESLGRFREAWGWYRLIARQDADHKLATERRDALARRLKNSNNRHRTELAASPAQGLDLAHVKLPPWARSKPLDKYQITTKTGRTSIRFRDDAVKSGLRFQYENADVSGETGMRMIETMGGGVAALDFDRDGRPDLYFSQGGKRFPVPAESRPAPDRLFFNSGNGSFLDVTDSSRLGDRSFTHGVAVGDYNSDGWPDIYIANIGRNRLYRNNGDGTFTDVSDSIPLSSDKWTISCLIADLNGDGHPDLYDVNYLQGNDPLTQLCTNAQGLKRACAPSIYEADFDQLLLSDGRGGFRNITKQSGIQVANGKGLGIVAADFTKRGTLDLFVSNDTVANFLFSRRNNKPDGVPQFEEIGLRSGVALDRDGKSQACMGIAVDDADGDGRLDLFVTNFYNEANTLYLQQLPGVFRDKTSTSGLHNPGYSKLGFGTQFLDADLDGWPDLVVANGHIDDFTHTGAPFRMVPQFFRNVGKGRFREARPADLGRYFQRKLIGRTLARLDWNGDGRDDFVVSHLFDPVSLLTNTTATKHHWLAIRLSGTQSSRDAIGTTVSVKVADRTIVKQLIAGDGYASGNERRLTFGIGTNDRIKEVTVRWPSGREQVFRNVRIDRENLLVEGDQAALLLPADQ